jgi:holo-[acyl-carrier protein] synthase
VNIGIDIIENPRFRQAMERHPRLVERIFTVSEQEYCRSRPDPVQHFAVRFAAKEAVGKALGTGVRRWREIEISGGGKPDVRISGLTRSEAERAGNAGLSVSLSHSGEISVAVALAGKY